MIHIQEVAVSPEDVIIIIITINHHQNIRKVSIDIEADLQSIIIAVTIIAVETNQMNENIIHVIKVARSHTKEITVRKNQKIIIITTTETKVGAMRKNEIRLIPSQRIVRRLKIPKSIIILIIRTQRIRMLLL
jgi:hypothetical protein